MLPALKGKKKLLNGILKAQLQALVYRILPYRRQVPESCAGRVPQSFMLHLKPGVYCEKSDEDRAALRLY